MWEPALVDIEWGFGSVKDALDVLIVPVAIFALGLLWPWRSSRQRRATFLDLIGRELEEMGPHVPGGGRGEPHVAPWPNYLDKKFIHEEIFKHLSDNRDFILSLPPDLAYDLTQLWRNFNKAHDEAGKEEDLDADRLARLGRAWLHHLESTCVFFDRRATRRIGGLVNVVKRTRRNRDRGSTSSGRAKTLVESIYRPWREVIGKQDPAKAQTTPEDHAGLLRSAPHDLRNETETERP